MISECADDDKDHLCYICGKQLGRFADYAALDRAIAAAGALDLGLYINDDNMAAFKDALSAANAVARGLTDDRQGTVDRVEKDLTAAMAALRPVESPDGSRVSTVPVSGKENSIQATVSVKENEVVLTDISDADIKALVGSDGGIGIIEIDVTALGENITSMTLTADTLDKIADAVRDNVNDTDDTDGMSVRLPTVTVTFDAAALREISRQANGSDVQLRVESIEKASLNAVRAESVSGQDIALILDISLWADDRELCTEAENGFAGGKTRVFIPYGIANGQAMEDYSVFCLAEDGTQEKQDVVYDETLGGFVFVVDYVSVYVLAYEGTM